MDNKHEPPSGDPQDFWPTQEIPPSIKQPGPSGAPPASPRPARRYSRAVWWGAGLALIALLAGGGAAAAELTSNAVPSTATGQAAQLNTLLNSASSTSPATTDGSLTTAATTNGPCVTKAEKLKADGFPGIANAVLRRCGHRLRRLRLLGGIHGSFTFETKTGPRTLAYQRGVIESVSGSDVVVQSKDGTTWTWVLQSNTVIHQNGQKVSTSALSSGEHVFAGGPVVSGGYNARLIVIANSASSTPSPGSTPSPSSSASGS
jgi:hypothetical protein